MSSISAISSPIQMSQSRADVPKFAIILNGMKAENSIGPQVPSVLTQDLVQTKDDGKYKDVGQLAKILQEKIKLHAGVEASLFTGKEIIEENPAALIPLMFRVAVEEFSKTCKNEFKIIECRHETKLSSNWKPSLSDILIARKHQVIVVDLKESFLPYTNFAYAILRQLDREWRIKMPRCLFHPNDVCTVEKPNKNLIMVSPSMPDGDFKLSGIASPFQYKLLTMFKLGCMDALKNQLQMRDLRIGKFEDIVADIARIRTIYRRAQRWLLLGQEIQIGSDSCMELLKQMESVLSANLTTAANIEDIGQRLFSSNTDESAKQQGNRMDFNREERFPSQGATTAQQRDAKGADLFPASNTKSYFDLSPSGDQPPAHNLSAQFSLADEKLRTQFERIEMMLSSGNRE